MRTVRELTPGSAAPPAASAGGSGPPDTGRDGFAADVREHLTRSPRQLPTRYLYDQLGSALFEAICHLPWYRITRAEERLLESARDELAGRLGPVEGIVELGPGSGAKLRRLLLGPAFAARPVRVHLVDLSRGALELAERTLSALPSVRVIAHEADYHTGLAHAVALQPFAGRTLVLFLGSNIGNFDPAESRALLRGIRAALRPGDALLLGADLVKPEPELVAAYDDPLGVTAAFNRNLLLRINRELDADFDVRCWGHRARWNEDASRVEMHLVARARQRVRIPVAGLEIDFEHGETVWTESSQKYALADIDALLEGSGFRVVARWTDEADGFALTLGDAS